MEYFENSRQYLFTGSGWIHLLIATRIVNIQQVQICDTHFQNVYSPEKEFKPFFSNLQDRGVGLVKKTIIPSYTCLKEYD